MYNTGNQMVDNIIYWPLYSERPEPEQYTKCPICGGNVQKSSYWWECIGTNGDDFCEWMEDL